MQQPLPLIRSQLRELASLIRNSGWFRQQPRHARLVELLDEVKESSELEAASVASRALWHESPAVRAAACQCIHQIVSQVPPIALLEIPNALTWHYSWYPFDAWSNLQPSAVQSLEIDAKYRASVLGLISFHQNGYIRHSALRLLAEIHDGSELSYLLIRQNDWVDAIRVEARSAVESRVSDAYLPHFVKNLDLVVRLSRLTRDDHSTIVNQVIQLLVQSQSDAEFATALQSTNRDVRRRVARIALSLVSERHQQIVRHVLASDDAVLRLHAARRLKLSYSGSELREVVEQLKRDPYMPVRREGFRLAADDETGSASNAWQQALLDRHPSIRELARFEISRSQNFDVPQFYRDALAASPDSLAALNGICETGLVSDIDVIKSYLNHPRPSRRRAAVFGIARIGGESAVPKLLKSLRDDSPSVSREAGRQLRPFAHLIQGSELLNIVFDDPRDHVRTVSLRLIFEMGKWRSLPWLIRSLAHQDPNVTSQAEELIESWFSPPLSCKVFTRSTDHDRQAINQALDESKHAINRQILSNLQSWLC